MQWTKDPDATLDYQWNWSSWLGTDTIDTSTFLIAVIGAHGVDDAVPDTTTLAEDDTAHDDTSATIWLTAGTLGLDYEVTNRVVTAGGRTEDRTNIVQVRQR